MTRKLLIGVLCALFVVLFVQSSGLLLAQEVTPEVTPVVVVADPPVASDSVTVPGWLLLNAAVVFTALGSLAVLVTNWQRSSDLKTALNMADKRTQDAIEAAYEALPTHVQETLRRVLDFAEYLHDQGDAVLEFVDEVTDGKPNDSPPEQG